MSATTLKREPKAMQAIRVVVADDEETVVDVLRRLIGSDPSLRLVGSAHDAEHAIDVVSRERPDVALVDVRMPGGGGIRAVREIVKRYPETKVVVLSAHDDLDTVLGMISAGAAAYVPKADPSDKILDAIHRSARGDPPEPRDAARAQKEERRDRVGQAILHGAIVTELEPIVDLEATTIVGVEVKPNVAQTPFRAFDAWRADAEAGDLLVEFELAAYRSALHAIRSFPPDLFAELEVSWPTALSPEFCRAVRRPVAARMVFGLPHGLRVGDPHGLDELDGLRARGVRVTARDVGSGVPSLKDLTLLRPDFARLDVMLSQAVCRTPAGHAIVAAVVACAEQVGATVIADGVRSREQLRELGRIGVRYFQGPFVDELLGVSALRPLRSAAEHGFRKEGEDADD